jgi:hypothetical protein
LGPAIAAPPADGDIHLFQGKDRRIYRVLEHDGDFRVLLRERGEPGNNVVGQVIERLEALAAT